METRTYTLTIKEKGSLSTTKTYVQASTEQEARRIVESRGSTVILVQYGRC
jgi:hypothetical protein